VIGIQHASSARKSALPCAQAGAAATRRSCVRSPGTGGRLQIPAHVWFVRELPKAPPARSCTAKFSRHKTSSVTANTPGSVCPAKACCRPAQSCQAGTGRSTRITQSGAGGADRLDRIVTAMLSQRVDRIVRRRDERGDPALRRPCSQAECQWYSQQSRCGAGGYRGMPKA